MSGARRAAAPSRYLWAKFRAAAEETFFHLTAPTRQEAATISGKATGASSPTLASALATFSQAYSRNLTTVMLIAGNAMYPNLNRNYEKDKGAVEKLVVRLLPRASAATVFVGDVLAFHSPLAASSTAAAGSGGGASVMVRRVVAMEEGEMVVEGDASEATVAVIPKGHFWALADNPELKPPHVIDSRTYGHVPLRYGAKPRCRGGQKEGGGELVSRCVLQPRD